MQIVSFCVVGCLLGNILDAEIPLSSQSNVAVSDLQSPPRNNVQENELATIKDPQAKNILKNTVVKDTNLKSVLNLRLDNAQISTLEGFGIFKSLTHLSLSGNLINNITPIAQLKCLKTLDLSKNQIVVPAGIGSLEYLESLDLSHNQLKYAFCCSFTSLRYLRLNDNNIQQLIFINNFNKLLEEVDVSNNMLKNIVIKAPLLSLKKLSANGTFLTQIDDLKHLQNLEVLELKNCPYLHSIAPLFNRLENHWQCKLNRLKKLSISEEFLDKDSKNILADIKSQKNSILTVQ
ncbi:MAG: leucine-rich repeat domain-containing protein [bacterium]